MGIPQSHPLCALQKILTAINLLHVPQKLLTITTLPFNDSSIPPCPIENFHSRNLLLALSISCVLYKKKSSYLRSPFSYRKNHIFVDLTLRRFCRSRLQPPHKNFLYLHITFLPSENPMLLLVLTYSIFQNKTSSLRL